MKTLEVPSHYSHSNQRMYTEEVKQANSKYAQNGHHQFQGIDTDLLDNNSDEQVEY